MIRTLLFDAMETVVSIHPIPDDHLRCEWLWENSKEVKRICTVSQLYVHFRSVRSRFDDRVASLREYRWSEMAEGIATELAGSGGPHRREMLREDLEAAYEVGYFSHCSIAGNVRAAIDQFAKKYRLGIVSNQIVVGGLERFLAREGHLATFASVTSSATLGWRKPAKAIYDHALATLEAAAGETVFVGDDLISDYEKPLELGMRAVLYDPAGAMAGNEYTTVRTFDELPRALAALE